MKIKIQTTIIKETNDVDLFRSLNILKSSKFSCSERPLEVPCSFPTFLYY